jgi:2-polyprenyl-3-methyl-5-hydroxy-6-metoxy-1,4-benzoquinol methylase
MNFENSYSNTTRADSYAKLEFPNTYYLAYRDLPEIINKHVSGKKAIDFGCGSGRSTRFLQNQGFEVTGIDISEEMLQKAREFDPAGNYQKVTDGNYEFLGNERYDLVLSVFTFDNIPGAANRIKIITELRKLLKKNGIMILLDSTEDLYKNEWASFSTKKIKENTRARSGEIVKVIMKDVEDQRPVEDIFWTDTDYREAFFKAKLNLEKIYKPLANHDEPYDWLSETTIAPWIIYVLKK